VRQFGVSSAAKDLQSVIHGKVEIGESVTEINPRCEVLCKWPFNVVESWARGPGSCARCSSQVC
jgi:hypothetical protein